MDAETYLRGCFRPELLSAKCYTPPSISCRVNLNQNESPWDVEEDVKREVVERVLARDWRRYPSGTTDALREAIARSLNVAPENILMGNGSNELICALISAVSDEDCTIATLRPTFGLYSHYAAVFGTNLAETKLNADLSFPVDALVTLASKNKTRLTILCSPNNPTGSVISLPDIERIARAGDSFVLLDEAYIEFAESSSAVELLAACPNMIVIRTFSKAFGMAGLRIGYMVCAPAIARELSKILPPYNVDIFAEEAALAGLRRSGALDERIRVVRSERIRLYDSINALSGWRAWPSQANFMLFGGPLDSETAFDEFLRRDVLLRKLASDPILDGKLRLSVGTPEENDMFLEALSDIQKNYGDRDENI